MIERPKPSSRQRAVLVLDWLVDHAETAQRAYVGCFCLLFSAPLLFVVGARAVEDGCSRMAGATLALGIVFFLPGLAIAVPKLRLGWLWLAWAAAVVLFIVTVASGPTPITCPAWER